MRLEEGRQADGRDKRGVRLCNGRCLMLRRCVCEQVDAGEDGAEDGTVL